MESFDLHYPFAGRWLVQNSPANRVPSHGITAFASSYAIDFVPVGEQGRTAPMTLSSWVRPETPTRFPGFGREVLAPVDGLIVAVADGEPDHPAYRGWPSVGYALRQRSRVARGWSSLAGNHVLIRTDRGTHVALCHLQQGSVAVRVGQEIGVGEVAGGCGNSGNSTEPHLHLQAMDDADPLRAAPVPISFEGSIPRNGQIVSA
ncbi:M23 family metallopeptidase [Enemella sp. A6]|uniref:M23 family metallopeptidase n=1 Tax=Enemella sp. A6 TaxID=3440152 RepID=UPI003EBB608B